MADTARAPAAPSPSDSSETTAAASTQPGQEVADTQASRHPLESARTVYVYFDVPRLLAFAIAWPGAGQGAPPRLEGLALSHRNGRCAAEIVLRGPPDSAYLGPQVQPLTPAARVSAAEGQRGPLLAFAPDCPSSGPVRLLDPNVLQLLRTRPLLLEAIRDSLEQERHAEVLLSQSARVQIWDYGDGERLALVNTALAVARESGVPELLLAVVRMRSSQPPRVVLLRSLGAEGWSPIGLADVDGHGRPELVFYAGGHGNEAAIVRIAVFREEDDGRWSLWRLIPIFQAFPYDD